MQRIEPGKTVSWQRKNCKSYSGVTVCFCQKGQPISSAIDLSKYPPNELTRIDVSRDSIDRYLIYVQNVGLVSVSAATIEKQNQSK